MRRRRVVVAALFLAALGVGVALAGWLAVGLFALGAGAWFVLTGADRRWRGFGLLMALDGLGSLYRHSSWGEPVSRVLSQLLFALLLSAVIVAVVGRRDRVGDGADETVVRS